MLPSTTDFPYYAQKHADNSGEDEEKCSNSMDYNKLTFGHKLLHSKAKVFYLM